MKEIIFPFNDVYTKHRNPINHLNSAISKCISSLQAEADVNVDGEQLHVVVHNNVLLQWWTD